MTTGATLRLSAEGDLVDGEGAAERGELGLNRATESARVGAEAIL